MSTADNDATANTAMPMSGVTPPRQCVRHVITTRLQKLLSNEDAARQGDDVDAVHDMRVASRRLREAFELFEFCFPQKSYQKFYRSVRQVTRVLGEVRNADVALIYFKNLSAANDDILVQVALEELLRRLARARQGARGRLIAGLNESRVRQLPVELAGVFARVENLPIRQQRGARQSIVLARRQIAQRVREFFSASAAVAGENDETNLHKVRISVKKLRYAIETFDYAVGETIVKNLQDLKHLQEILGELHDRDVFAGIVRARLAKLQNQLHANLLCNGLQAVLNMILSEREKFFRDYQAMTATYKLHEWRARFVPSLNPSQRRRHDTLRSEPAASILQSEENSERKLPA